MLRIGAMVGLGKFRLPLLLGIFSGEGGNFIIKDRNSRVGSLVGESSLRRQRLLSLRASSTASPRFRAAWSRVIEFQAGLWALKSPRIRESF